MMGHRTHPEAQQVSKGARKQRQLSRNKAESLRENPVYGLPALCSVIGGGPGKLRWGQCVMVMMDV